MTQAVKTGNYWIWRNKIGVGKFDDVIMEGSKEIIIEHYWGMEKEQGYNYFIEEQVIYKNSQYDDHGNLIDSAPVWLKLSSIPEL